MYVVVKKRPGRIYYEAIAWFETLEEAIEYVELYEV